MKSTITTMMVLLASLLIGTTANADPKKASDPSTMSWQTVANSQYAVPDDAAARPFNSFNPPSVNDTGVVVFRGRSRGPEPPASGIFVRDMSKKGSGALYRLAGRGVVVPGPNNTDARFNEFPSFPRIASHANIIATRGNSSPVWQPLGEDGEERVGTSGLYVAIDGFNLATSMAQLGNVAGFEKYRVPGIDGQSRFDQFPGAPAITDNAVLISKANYSFEGHGYTGIFYRNLRAGDVDVEAIADSQTTLIPGLPANAGGIIFGSTSPPSAADGRVVFVGYDNEQSPSYGGIYLAPISTRPELTALISLSDPVPDVPGATFSRFGEGLSFDGRHVAFWGAWGDETRVLRLPCPTEGNKDRLAFCRDDDPATNRESDERWQAKEMPVHQGIFAIDTKTGRRWLIAKTGDRFDDFVYWNYSGHPPGAGGGHADSEIPKWRSTAFVAISNSGKGNEFAAVFKARSGEISSSNGQYQNPVDGLYLLRQPGKSNVVVLADTTMSGDTLDKEAPNEMVLAELGLERDGLRGKYLAISASMLGAVADGSELAEEEESTWAGVYTVEIPPAFGQ